ncbi:papain fold toxin domain-containing protein [Leptolyngbya sp. AN03gr2]|uniref:papain fold toxin domain-containing protein n=1 Tax=unclassified Leptolyngbya TaxID=2650499 RepID=UPI003D3201FA
MSDLSLEEIYREVGAIVSQFDLLECAECAAAVLQWLDQQGIERSLLKLRTRYDFEDYILSDRLEMRGITEPITENGIHYGVKVRGKVFDNLSVEGMELEVWLSDFHCPSEKFVVQEMDNFSSGSEVQ